MCTFLVLLGVFVFLSTVGNPRVSGLHGADKLRLIASGFAFGVGFGVLVGGQKFPGE